MIEFAAEPTNFAPEWAASAKKLQLKFAPRLHPKNAPHANDDETKIHGLPGAVHSFNRVQVRFST
jgi:hypothetical protein